MLEYRQNIRYSCSDNYNIDAELEELKQLCKKGIDDYQLYNNIRQYIYKEIKIKELAVTIVLTDLLQIRQKSDKAANIIEYFIAKNHLSYSEVAKKFNCSKQYIHQTLQRFAKDYYWLNNLFIVKGLEDSKNENNRTKFFSGKRKVDLYKQMDLFGDEDEN